MRAERWTRSLGVALLLAAGVPALTAQEADDATRRAIAREEWYNEVYRPDGGKVSPERIRNGGLWSAEFRRFMMEAAARERQKWGSLIPGHGEASEVRDSGRDSVEARGGATWANIGPTKADYIFNGVTLNVTDSGRVRSFAPHPSDANILYVAYSGGGVWKTVNGGVTWTPITEGVGSLSVGSLAMDPSNPNVLYLGLGDPFDGTGIGLLKTTNGGTTWSSPVFLGNASVIPQVFVSPANANIVLAATDKGLFRSTDSGATFALVSIATGQPGPPYVWSIASTGGARMVLSLEADPLASATGQIWYSGDNGATWKRGVNVTAPTGVERITVASAPSSPNIVYAMATNPAGNLAEILRSTTGGGMWRSMRTTRKSFTNPTPNVSAPTSGQFFNTQGWYDHLLIVDPANPNRIFFGGALNTATTADGGNTYQLVSEWLGRFGLPYVHADAHTAAYDAAGNLLFGTDGGVFKSTNNGINFTDALNLGVTTHLVYNLGSSTSNRSLVVGGFQDNGTRTRDASTTTYNQTIGGDGFGCDVKSSNASHVLGSLYNARVYKSVNGGVNFSQSCAGITECGSGSAPFYTKVVPWTGSSTGDVVFTHANSRVYKSENYADSWSPTASVAGSTIRNIGVAQSNVQVLGIVGSGGLMFLSLDGGMTWTQPAALPNNGLSLSFIWFDRVDPDIIYVASVAPDAAAAHLWKSVDFGLSWARIDGGGFPTGVPVDVVKTDPANPSVVYAGTHLGMYRSDNGGTNWFRYGSGMPLVEVTDVYISADNSLVRASTFGRGFWELIP